jgi:accessory gene regulator protein AgrB
MRRLAEQLRRVRWLTVPLAAYLLVTLVLPAANGAMRRADFARHAAWVIACCALVLGMFVVIPTFAHLVRPILRRNR